MRSTESRPYRMRKRAQQVDDTRLRITEAAMRLHTTVGPARTTISAVAEEAGVTRLTVYRHFPDDEQLFAACSQHWLALHPPPDPAGWRRVSALEPRGRHALTELYSWFDQNAQALLLFERDTEAMPAGMRTAMEAWHGAMADALSAGARVRGRRRQRLVAAARLVTTYGTWRSLTIDAGLTQSDAVDLAVGFLVAAAS